jgi:drug/metabolite transporter (DMT)-like permease
MSSSTPRRATGILFMAGATLCWSTGGILLRNVREADGWEMVFWRSLFMAAFFIVVLAVRRGRSAPRQVLATGWIGAAAGCALGLTFFFYILSLERTTVANTQIILSLVPVTAALLGLVVLRERIAGHTWLAMALAFAGVGLMCWDSIADASGTGAGARTAVGLLLAFGVPVFMAANIVLLRRAGRSIEMAATVLIAGLVSMVAAFPFALPLQATASDLLFLALAGVFQLGLGCLLVAHATQHLRAAEIGLLALLESVLGPFWVWLGIGERPTDLSLLGGALVLSALAVNAALDVARRRGGVEAQAALR